MMQRSLTKVASSYNFTCRSKSAVTARHYLSTTATSSHSTNDDNQQQQQHQQYPRRHHQSQHEKYRHQILTASLTHVHTHGWTEDAIAQGVLTAGYPPSYIGMMQDNHSKPSDFINFFMNHCNIELQKSLNRLDANAQNMSHADILAYGIRHRLEMVIPYVQSQRWHEGMALGATPYNAPTTAAHLDKLVTILEHKLMEPNANQSTAQNQYQQQKQNLGPLEKGAIGTVYVMTELHLLVDSSPGYADTWAFLNDRINDLETIASTTASTGSPSSAVSTIISPESVIAATAVASSLGGAVLSLVTPAARFGVGAIAGTVVPQMMNIMPPPEAYSTRGGSDPSASSMDQSNNNRQHGGGTKVTDYDIEDLPPFEERK